MSENIKKEIKTVRDLKEVLANYDYELFFNVGTQRLGFEIDEYGSDCLSFGLISTDLENYLNSREYQEEELNTYVIYTDVGDNEIEEHHYEANSIEEALGKFFMDNECLSYDDIIEHLEI